MRITLLYLSLAIMIVIIGCERKAEVPQLTPNLEAQLKQQEKEVHQAESAYQKSQAEPIR